jgi:hypothetical protein
MALHIHQQLVADGTVAGLASRQHASLGRDSAFLPAPDVLETARMLLLDASLQALVIALTDADALIGGWPVDCCDVLVLCPPGGAAGAAKPAATVSNWVARSRYLRPTLVLIDLSDAAGVRRARAAFEDLGVVTPVACQTGAQRLDAADTAVASLRGSSRPSTP